MATDSTNASNTAITAGTVSSVSAGGSTGLQLKETLTGNVAGSAGAQLTGRPVLQQEPQRRVHQLGTDQVIVIQHQWPLAGTGPGGQLVDQRRHQPARRHVAGASGSERRSKAVVKAPRRSTTAAKLDSD